MIQVAEKMPRILKILKIYKFILFRTRDLKRLYLMKMPLMIVQLMSLGKMYENVCSPDLLFVAFALSENLSCFL